MPTALATFPRDDGSPLAVPISYLDRTDLHVFIDASISLRQYQVQQPKDKRTGSP